jgi:hypothetical protein
MRLFDPRHLRLIIRVICGGSSAPSAADHPRHLRRIIRAICG